MLSYEHISSLEKQLYDALNEIDYINTSMAAVFSAARNDLNQKRINDRADKFAIVRRLYGYLSNGICYEIAVNNLSLEFKLTPAVIKNITRSIYQQYADSLRPHKIYAAHALKKAGIKNKKIAEILNITAQTVSKYLNIKIDLS